MHAEHTSALKTGRFEHQANTLQDGDPKPKSYSQPATSATSSDGASTGVGLYAIVLIGGALAFGAYKYLQGQSQQEVSI